MARQAHPSERAIEAMAEASRICGEMARGADLVTQRDELWAEAAEEGASYAMIAAECGVSESTVKLRLAKFRGRKWAENV